MTITDRRTLKKFSALRARLDQHMKRKRVTESSATTADRIMYAMREILGVASPALRKHIKQTHGWKS